MERDIKKKLLHGNYEVGYGNPPAAGRFVREKSGNPRGRSANTVKKTREAKSAPDTSRDRFLKATTRIPLAGNLIKRAWIRFYEGSVPWEEDEYHVTSWDTAMKSSELADYSDGTVWTVQNRGKQIYLIDLVRGRFEFPELVAEAVKLHRKWGFRKVNRFHHLIIEDKGSGTSLIQ